MRSFKLSILFLLCFLSVKAQKRQNIYFLKNNGKYVTLRDSADFIRVIQEPDSGMTDFALAEAYLNGKPKTRGYVSKFEPELVYEGQVLRYRDDGSKESVTLYNKGQQTGKTFYFFKNGKVSKVLNYDSLEIYFPKIKPLPYGSDFLPFRLEYQEDSTGNVLVEGGKGHLKQKIKVFKDEEAIEEGDYRNGLKEGIWTETGTSGNYWAKDTFKQGNLVSGQRFKDGQTYTYTVESQVPVFKGGMEQFYRFLARKIRYPLDAQREKISGKVFLSFVVEKDGSLSDINVVRSVFPSIDEEAVKVLKQSPNWIPGIHRGLPIRVKYNLPIAFALP